MVLIRLIMQPLWLADINAVDTTVVTFPHHPLQALAQLRDVYLRLVCLSGGNALLCRRRSAKRQRDAGGGQRIAASRRDYAALRLL